MTTVAELQQQIESVRAAISSLRAEQQTLQKQKLSRAELHAHIDRKVSAWHEEAITATRLDLQKTMVGQSIDLLTISAPRGTINLGPWLTIALGQNKTGAWLKSLTTEFPQGLDGTQWVERLAAIDTELVQACAAEEALLREADAMGHIIDPRPDADPRAALLLGWGDKQ